MEMDNKKLILIYVLIAFILLVLGTFIIVGVLNLDNDSKKLVTTTTKTTVQDLTTTTSTTTLENIISTSTTTTSKMTSSKTTATTTTSTTTVITTTLKVDNDERVTTDSNSTYQNAIDSWEWEVVDAINEERKKNGLEELSVAVDLRNLAEEAADLWKDDKENEMNNLLEGYSHYGYKSNVLDNIKGYESLYNATIQNTRVTSNKYLKYLGVGVIYQNRGMSGLKSYYYIIIYE